MKLPMSDVTGAVYHGYHFKAVFLYTGNHLIVSTVCLTSRGPALPCDRRVVYYSVLMPYLFPARVDVCILTGLFVLN